MNWRNLFLITQQVQILSWLQIKKKITKVLTFGDVRGYLLSHGSREPKHPNKSFIKKFGSIKTITYLCETYIPQMYVRENLCVWVFFLKKKVLKFLTNQNKSFTFVEEIKFLKRLKDWCGCCVEVSNPSGFIRSSDGRAYTHIFFIWYYSSVGIYLLW